MQEGMATMSEYWRHPIISAMFLVAAVFASGCSDSCADIVVEVRRLHDLVIRDHAKFDRIAQIFDQNSTLAWINPSRLSITVDNQTGAYVEVPLGFLISGSSDRISDQIRELDLEPGLKTAIPEILTIMQHLTSEGIFDIDRNGAGAPGDELVIASKFAFGFNGMRAYIYLSRDMGGFVRGSGNGVQGFTPQEWCNPTYSGELRWKSVVRDWYVYVEWT